VQRDRDRTDGRRPFVDADGELVVAAVDPDDAVDAVEGSPGRVGVAFDARDDDVGADGALELGGGALGDEPPVVDDADAVGELVGFLEVLRGEEDRHAELVVEPPHLLPHAGAADGIESGGGLVEEQDVGVVHERGGEVEPPAHATRVGADATVERVAEVDQCAQVDQALLDLAAAEAVELALEPQQLEPGLLGVERDVLERHADVQPHLLRLRGDVEAGDLGAAA
jgi:hypothetical protein